jgi:hypothetical protein
VERRRPITEEDLLLTELLLARSFENLKQSAVQTTSRSLRSAGGSLRQHPYAIAGAAVGAGILLYGIFRLVNRNGSVKKSNIDREYSSRSGVTLELLALILPIVKPYITAYLEKYMDGMVSKDRT